MSIATPKPHSRQTAWQRFRSGNLSDTQLGFLLLTPALLTLAFVMFYPIANVLWRSLHFERLNQPQKGTPFIGLEHFREMLWGREMTWDVVNQWPLRLIALIAIGIVLWLAAKGNLKRTQAAYWTLALIAFAFLLGFHPGEEGRWNDRRFWNSFQITWLIIIVSVTGAFLVGLPLALMANIKSRWRWLARIALLVPWVMPRVFVGIVFAWMFNSTQGVINDLLSRVGITGPLWLSREVPAIVVVNLTIIWTTSSFVALILLAGLQSIDDSLLEAAHVDGANRWQRFWHIVLPLLRPAIAVALIFRTLTAFQTFDIPYALTAGGPGRTLEVLGIYIQRTTSSLDLGYAAALSVMLFLMSLSGTMIYLRWIYRDE
ncbi:MAG: carbohydrate ABC transporter permease [Trueperaceae bacterium]